MAVTCAACAVLWLLLSATSARADEAAPAGSLPAGVTSVAGGALPSDTTRPVTRLVDPLVHGAADAARRTAEVVRSTTGAVPSSTVHRAVHARSDTTDGLVDRVAGAAPSVADAVEQQPPSPHSTAPARHAPHGAAASPSRRHAHARHARAPHRSGPAQEVLTTQTVLREARGSGSGAAAHVAVPAAKPAVRGLALVLGHVVPVGSTGLLRDAPDGPLGPVPQSPWPAALVAGLLLVVVLRVWPRRPARGWILHGAPSYPPGSSPD